MGKKDKLDEHGFRKFGMLDKVSYAAGDFGCNMSFALAGSFFTLFWTQYMKIDSLIFAGLLVLLKIWDAVNDPIMGMLMDSSRKEYKLGKFRTFIARGAIGLIIAAGLCFIPLPGAPMAAKIIICLVGYMAWDASYTIVNVPYGSMLSVISADAGDRAQLGAWRNLGALVAQLPINAILPMLLYDENNELMGAKLFVVALVLGVVAFISFRFMITTTVERVKEAPIEEDAPKFNLLQALKNFATNRPALGATLIPVGMFLGSYGAATASTVMFQSYFKNAQISGLVSLVTMVPAILWVPFAKRFATKYGKKEASVVGMFVSLAACLLMVVIPMPASMTGVGIYILLQTINGFGMGVGSCLSYAMMADAMDYNEWKHGVREEGMTYALHSFFRKLAQGLGPSIGLVFMVALGYNEQLGAAQPENVALAMRYLVAAFYLFSAVLVFVGIKFIYNLDKKTMGEMNKALGRE